MSARDTAPLRPQPGDLVTAEVESLPRIIRDIEAWCNDESDTAAQPSDLVCDIRDRLQGLVDADAALVQGRGVPQPLADLFLKWAEAIRVWREVEHYKGEEYTAIGMLCSLEVEFRQLAAGGGTAPPHQKDRA